MKRLITGLFTITFSCLLAQENPAFTIYLIGDTGSPELANSDPVFENLKKRIEQENEESAIIFLGNHINPQGMPPTSVGNGIREDAEKKMLVQLEAIKNFKGEIYFLPGNRDWNNGQEDGLDYILAQEEFMESFLDRGDVFIPDEGCPGPEVKKLGEDIVLIAMDSQWWLYPDKNDHIRQPDCKNINQVDIIQELKEILDENDEKLILLSFHHPLFSDGSHDGYFPLKDHLFPFTSKSKGLFIPLPGIGSIYPFIRSTFGTTQDLPHHLYQEFKSEVLLALNIYKNVLITSGHEHNLQYFYENDHHFIKSGSGTETSPLPKLTDAIFNSNRKGYAKVELLQSGEVWLSFYTIEKDMEKEAFKKLLFKKVINPPNFQQTYQLEEEFTLTAPANIYNKGGFHKFFFGKLYRKDWSTQVNFRNINLSTEKGGLRPIKAGGGMSSTSLRLEDKSGDQYVLRSVQKNISKVVPPDFRNSLVQSIFQDQIAASQPYAALAVPPLANAAEVYHTNPELVYLPNQPGLGEFEPEFGEDLYLFEERPVGDKEDDESFGNSRKIISYSKMIDKLEKTPKHHVHQEQVLKSRLFDIYLGDWDRHDDQWRWASFKETHQDNGKDEELTFYEPIPRDRDQVFYRYKGFIPWLSKVLDPQLRKFQTFKPTINNVNYLGFNARHFDKRFLNKMNRSDWIAAVEKMKSNLTDSVIAESISLLPEETAKKWGEHYTESLKTRRDDLSKYAEEYYNFLAEYIDVVGTEKNELFEVVRNEDNTTLVHLHRLDKKGEKEEVLYERIFIGGETKEVRLFGLEGDDQFVLSGEQKAGPLIRIIGGEGEDIIRDSSDLRRSGKGIVVYDTKAGNDFQLGRDAEDKRSDDYLDNLYDRKEFYYGAVVGLPLISYNPDDGVRLSYQQLNANYGFRKKPFASAHAFSATYAFGSSDIRFGYQFSLIDIVDELDFNLQLGFSVPSEVNNYFGLSNEITFDADDVSDFDFYRYEQTRIYLKPSLGWVSDDLIHRLQYGPYFLYTNLHDDAGKFVNDPNLSDLEESDFDDSHYTGFDILYQINKVDDGLNPTTGLRFSLNPSINVDLNDEDKTFTRIYGSLALYNFFWVPKPLVWATKIEGGINIGDYNFFQANFAGRTSGLRAFSQNRFGGDSSFIWSNDLRLELTKSKNRALPFSLGIIGSYDYGRVWNEGQVSSTWHSSYGGGVWFDFFNVLPLSFYYMTSNEGEANFIISMGFGI